MQPFSRLSSDPDTGDMLIDGVPADAQEVRDFLHQPGEWDSGEFIVRAGQVTRPRGRRSEMMNETKHTPVPWKVYGNPGEWPGIDSDTISVVIYGEDGDFERGIRGESHEEAFANAQFIVRAVNAHYDLLAACETLWAELKNKLASIDIHPGFPFAEDSPCTVYFLDRIVQCSTMTEGIAKCDELMAEEFPDVFAAIAAAKGSPQ